MFAHLSFLILFSFKTLQQFKVFQPYFNFILMLIEYISISTSFVVFNVILLDN